MNRTDLASALQQKPVVLLDFYAGWCAPCKILAPTLDLLVKELNFELLKIDIDESRDLPVDYAVTSIPHLVLIKDGVKVWEQKGFLPFPRLKAKLLDLGVNPR